MLFLLATLGKNVTPRAATLLDVPQASHMTKVVSPTTYAHPSYAGNAIATVQWGSSIQVVTVRTTRFDRRPSRGRLGLSSFVDTDIAKIDRPELTAAKINVSGDRALGSSDKFNDC